MNQVTFYGVQAIRAKRERLERFEGDPQAHAVVTITIETKGSRPVDVVCFTSKLGLNIEGAANERPTGDVPPFNEESAGVPV